MSLEQFKTQILLLHSEQSTLDNLSAGFNERYTVHCATSGSEALNTLGQTDIDIIVTAQDLPGMSGLDALREAKKRSPETIGILLAGNNDEGVEALVGDQEVFQIVRGGVTPESLRGVIDNATRQSRLMALAESANDTTADMDEPGAEHIVMETSENGSAIISDGTGRMPVLNPDKVASETNVGSRGVDVLVLTKDQEFLTTVKESARGMHNVIYANTLAQADEAVAKHKIGVAVVDAAMVGGNVEKLTVHLRATAPRLVSIVAGRRDDGEMLMDLINRGKVYRFLLKPVSPGRARLAVEASVKHHLEAPDSAFKTISSPTSPKSAPKAEPKSVPKAQPKPEPTVESKPKPKPKPKPKAEKKAAPAPKPKPKPEQSQSVPTIKVEPRLVPVDSSSLMDDALGTAFGGDDTSFTETMTGIVKTVGESISSVAGGTKTEVSIDSSATETPVETAGSGGSLFSNPKFLGLGAAAVIAMLAVGWWMFGRSGDLAPIDRPSVGTPSVTGADPIIETPAPVQPEIDIDELLEEARLAATAGRLFNPPGSNAIEFYLTALQSAPGNSIVAGELAGVIDQTLGVAESSLLERRPEDVAAALQRVALADPGNARLPFLTAQLGQMQLRDFLDTSRLAIREGRHEDAAVALDSARALGMDTATEIDVVAEELSRSLIEQRVGEVLAKANARFDEGKLTTPSNDNARYYYELALSSDPGNTFAQQGIAAVASKLVLMARAEIDAGRFDAADILLADARRLDPGSAELATSVTALSAARDRAAEEQRLAEERAAEEQRLAEERAAEEQRLAEERAAEEQRLAEERAAEEQRLAEERAAEEQRIADQRAADEKAAAEKAEIERLAAAKLAAERAAADRVAADRLSIQRSTGQSRVAQSSSNQVPVINQQTNEAVADEPLVAEPIDDSASDDAPLPDEPVIEEQVAFAPLVTSSVADTAEPEPEVAREQVPILEQAPVAVSSLRRTKYVAPKYPRAAQRRNMSGWVDLVFTVDIDGTVQDISVRQSNPGITFVNAAVSAVEDWEFEPVVDNGVAIQKRAAIRMLFALE